MSAQELSGTDDDLWGGVPREQRLAWLRVASRYWPAFPGSILGGYTSNALAGGSLVRRESLIRVARNAYDAGFSPVEYGLLRELITGRVPDHLVISRDPRAEYADRFFEIDARQWRDWLRAVRAGELPATALERFLHPETHRSTKDELPAEVSPEEFARVWTEFLEKTPATAGDRTRWAYVVQAPGEVGRPTGASCTLPEALERLRTEPGSRLCRRIEGEWSVAPNPLPRAERADWGALDRDLREEWYRAISTCPPSRMSTIARMGGVDGAPDEWRMLARRAHALGFTPRDYKQLALGVSVLRDGSASSVPAPYDIEFWVAFPAAAAATDTPDEAVRAVLHRHP